MAAVLWGCVPPPEVAPSALDRTGAAQPERTVCGWEELDQAAPRLTIGPDGKGGQVPPGGHFVVLSASAEAPFQSVLQGLEPLVETLVRVKVVVDGRWLVPMTYPYRRPVSLPKPDKPMVRTVGHRRITRSVGAPAERFADLRLAGDQVQLFVEHGGRGETLPVSKLAQRLRESDPPVGTFALRVTDETTYGQFVTVMVAAACYDREPGAEAHEVILD